MTEAGTLVDIGFIFLESWAIYSLWIISRTRSVETFHRLARAMAYQLTPTLSSYHT